jgi:ABC-type sugar transport system ATPase subunit
MGERICIMNHGRIVQTGPPMAVYRHPADTFVAGFLASPPMNLLDARLDSDGSASLADGLRIPLPEIDHPALAAYRDRPVILGIRPEDLREQPGGVALPLRVVAIEALGPEVILIASLQDGRELAARMSRDFTAPIGSAHRLWLDPAAVHLFDPATTKVIPRDGRASS